MKEKKIKVGILGGSFNPPHKGHLTISKEAIKRFDLHKLLWVVSKQNPLKALSDYKYLSFEERFSLCKDITKSLPKILVSDAENKLGRSNKVIFTIDLLDRISTENPEYDIHFIIGADNLLNFHKWDKHKELMDKYRFIVFDRASYKYKALSSKAGVSKNYEFVNCKKVRISSTEIRQSKS